MRRMLALALACASLHGQAWAQDKPVPVKPPHSSADDLLGAPDETDDRALRTRDLDNGCFVIEREPGPAGGLRIPEQAVCPAFSPPRQEAPEPSAKPKRLVSWIRGSLDQLDHALGELLIQ